MRACLFAASATIAFASFLLAADSRIGIPINELGTKYDLVGKTHEPLGALIGLEGFVVEGPFKGFEGGLSLRVQRINGKATQEFMRIRLKPYFLDFGEKDGPPKLEMGKSYVLEGYETGGFVGRPRDAYNKAGIGIQTTEFYFSTEFIVVSGKAAAPIHFAPADFVDRKALLEGKATSRNGKSWIEHDGWRLLINDKSPWPAWMHGKTAEAFGVIRRTSDPNEFRLDNGTSRLLNLADQVGHPVELRGTALSLNGHWWFNYRGQEIYVDGMDRLPGWDKADNHRNPILIRGTLSREIRPADPRNPDDTTKTNEFYVVRGASWRPLEMLLSPERDDRH